MSILLYLLIGVLALSVLGLIDDYVKDLKKEISAETICRPILAVIIWPLWIVVFWALL